LILNEHNEIALVYQTQLASSRAKAEAKR